MQVILNHHKHNIGGNTEEKNKWKEELTRIGQLITDPDITKVEFYNLAGEKQNYRAGNKARLVVWNNATRMGAGNTQANATLFGESILLLPTHQNGVNIDLNDITIAQYYVEQNEVCILFDLFKSFSNERAEIMEFIFRFVESRLTSKYDHLSWEKTPDKEAFMNGIKNYLVFSAEIKAKESKERITSIEEHLRNMRNEMASKIRQLEQQRRVSNVDENYLSEMGGKIIQHLELIANHPKVKNIFFIQDVFTVHTIPLICYEGDNKYNVGSFRIEIKPEITSVKFFGDTPRKSYWGENCPHPHVNGNTGEACLGNAQPVIAELSAQSELFPLVDYCISFLESVNVSDSAGKFIRNWDLIDESGEILVEGSDADDSDDFDFDTDDAETFHCVECLEDIDVEFRVSVLDGDRDEVEVCEQCRAVHYHFDETIDGYVHD